MTLSKRQRRLLNKNGVLDDNVAVPQRGMNLKSIEAKTFSQQRTFDAWEVGNNLLLHGTAGTGKTFISLYLAMNEIFNNPDNAFNSVTIVRSVVPTRDIGFLPGKEDEKIGVYEEPYKAICNELFRRGDAYDILKFKGLVNFMCTSFIRGLTINDTIVVVDEIQNMSGHELSSVITRLGENCKVIFCGDFSQTDLTRSKEREGLSKFMRILDHVDGFEHVEFLRHDIVRSKLVKDFICAQEDLGISLCM